jgi:hypothetical protein
VRIADDGTTAVTQEPVTAGQQRAERAAALSGTAPKIARADCGNWYATKLFDQPGYVGNELCVLGEGQAWLSSFCRIPRYPYCAASWDAAVRSVWTGQSFVWFVAHDAYWQLEGAEDLPAYEARSSVGPSIQRADEILLGLP